MIARKLTLATGALLCLLVGALTLSSPVALAVTPPAIEDESVFEVAGTSATLRATIDPQGSLTTYRFEYGTSTAYGSQMPVPDALVGSGSSGVAVSAHVQGLSPRTVYHYRAVAIVGSRSEVVPGSDGTFTTQASGSELALPDGRQWQLVSSPNKHGATIKPISQRVAGLVQAASSGGRISYVTTAPTELEPPGYAYLEQVISQRGAQGWESRDITPTHEGRTGLVIEPEYQFFSSELTSALTFPTEGVGEASVPTLLSAKATEPTPYIRNESVCDDPTGAGECYSPVLTGKEGIADVAPGVKFGEGRNVQFEGATTDLDHVVLLAHQSLTSTSFLSEQQVYEWSADKPPAEALQPISVLPENEGGGPDLAFGVKIGTIGNDGQNFSGSRHAISDDGSRVFWGNQQKALYMRDTVKQETIRLDVQQPGAPSAPQSEPYFQAASGDGSRVFFTDNDYPLTSRSGMQGQDIYECKIVESAGKLKCELADLTPEEGSEPAEVQSLIAGASEDGSYVYFVANGVVPRSGATKRGDCKAGDPTASCNLYVDHEGAIDYVATLSEKDENVWGGNDNLHFPGRTLARVSPNGRYLTFMSDSSLTGYDNRDANSGKSDAEVYVYDALAKHLACVSCNPTGSRPVGVEVAQMTDPLASDLVDIQSGEGGSSTETDWVASNVPMGVPLQTGGQSLYQPRYLSDDGRVFFNSSDSLVPQDVDGTEDVYEFEPAGIGGCKASSATFDVRSGGCVYLISSGSSPEESGFLDASEGGGDVFFLTTSRLASQDFDRALDIYDAHECSESVPCSVAPASPPPCDSGDSCKAAPTPQPATFGAPASSTFDGSGNVPKATPTPAVAKKSLTRKQKLSRALRVCRKEHGKKRTICERQARRRFRAVGSKQVVKTTKRSRG